MSRLERLRSRLKWLAEALCSADAGRALASRIRDAGIKAAIPLITTGRIARGSIAIELDRTALAAALEQPARNLHSDLLAIAAPFTCRRRGTEIKIVAGEFKPTPDITLIRNLADAHRWADALRSGTPLGDIARREGHADSYIRTRAQLAFLAPKIQAATLEGTLPPDVSTKRLIAHPLPLDWTLQLQLVGF